MAEGENKATVKVDHYAGIKPEIVDKLKKYENDYFRWDKPIPFCGLTIYPVKLVDYETFLSCSSVFTLNRKEDPVGITMTNLDYLNYKLQKKENEEQKEEAAMLAYSLQKVCEIIFHIQNGLKCKKCEKILSYDGHEFQTYLKEIRMMADQIEKGDAELTNTPQLKCPGCGEATFLEMIKIIVDPNTKKASLLVDGHSISSKEYDLLRYLVLYQNFSDYRDDSWVDPELKADYEAKMKIEQRQNDVHASLEKKMVALHISTGTPLEKIYDMTIRKFTMALGTVEDLINYKIMKTASMSGLVSLPKGTTIEHWIYKKDVDMYGDAYKDVDQLKNEVNNT